MNVQMRIITEDNIDQLPSMSYSKNVYRVLKDGKGAMGVDDIIERNRLAAGLKPRDMRKMAADAAAKSGVPAVGYEAADDDEEATTGSRVYLPSRSEQEEEERLSAQELRTASNASAKFDPDERIDEIIPDLDIDTKQSIRNLGWRFALKADVLRQLQAADSGTARSGKIPTITSSDVNSEDLVLESIILDKNGEPTEKWNISGRQWVGDYPTRYPDGWLSEMLVYPDDTPISPSDMVEELRATRKPMNWVTSIISLMDKYARRKMVRSQSSTTTTGVKSQNEIALDENERSLAENERETQRVSNEIARAKREGNIAEEERLKVQMTRLADERVKLDSVRREMKREMEADEERQRRTYAPSSPKYSSIFTPEGVPDEQQADEVRRAVGSFNAKMLEKYGENDENIPETDDFTPRTPSSPAYSSMFEGGGRQRGGGKFIPQIPSAVLENYLNSKYGVSSKHVTETTAPMSGMMTGGGGGSGVGLGSLPTMNIPVVATMPMAGMMPVQQGPVAAGAQLGGQPNAASAATAAAAQQGGQQLGGGGTGQQTNEPNAQGVKTFSIRM